LAEIDIGSKTSSWLGWFLAAAAVLLVGVVFVTLSALNSRDLELVIRDQELQVLEGDFLPWGRSPFVPSEAFTPLHIPEEFAVDGLPLGKCDNRDDCEERFYRSILSLAQYQLARRDDDGLASAKTLIVRAQLFPSIDLSERAPIEDLEGGVHYVEALVLLESIHSDLELVNKRLHRAQIAGVGVEPAGEIESLIQMVERQLFLMETRQLESGAPPGEAPL